MALLEPAVEQMGYELTDLEVRLGARDGVLRLFIDKTDGVGLDDCEAVSRQVSTVLDVEDPMPGHYTLEVSSPGLDRRLSKAEHFQRFQGEDVRIKLRVPNEGRRNYRGTIGAVSDDAVEVQVDGQWHRLALDSIAMARLVPQV